MKQHFVSVLLDNSIEEDRDLFKKFSIRGTPTVIVLTPEGEEVDRFIGYGGNPEETKTDLERMAKGENTLLSIRQALEKNPDDLALLAKAIRKFQDNYLFDDVSATAKQILKQGDLARDMAVPYGVHDEPVSVYSYAKLALTIDDPDMIPSFVDEFSDTPLKGYMFDILGRHLRRSPDKQQILSIYNKILRKYPDDHTPLKDIVRNLSRDNENAVLAIPYAEKLVKILGNEAEAGDRMNCARVFLAGGNDKQALAVYGPDFAETLIAAKKYYRAEWLCLDVGITRENLESALNAANRAIAFKPGNDNIWDTLSMVYWKMGNHEEAIRAEEKALELNPGAAPYKERIEKIREDMSS